MKWIRNKKQAVGLTTLFILIATFFLIRSDIFTIKALDVDLEKITCTDANQIRNSSKILGQNLIFLNSSKIQDDLKDKFFCVKSIGISKYLPNKVKLQIFGRKPAAILVVLKSQATQSGVLEKFSETAVTPDTGASPSASLNFLEGPRENFVVDSEGVIYSTNIEQINAPKIYLGQNLTLGQKLQGNLISNTLKILEKIRIFGLEIKEERIYSTNVLLVNATPQILFRLDGNIDTQLASLQLILHQAKIDEANLEFIDLRFDKPIVKLAPKKNGKR